MSLDSNSWNDRFKIVRDKVKWNDAVKVVQKQRTTAAARTDSDSTFCAESTPPPPPPPPPPPKTASKKCSTCSCRLRAGSEEPVLQQVVAKLHKAELEEAAGDERVEATRQRLRHAAQVLEAQMMYLQSLEWKACALARLTQLTGNFACKELPPSSTLNSIMDEIQWDVGGQLDRLANVRSVVGPAAETPDRLCQLMDDFQDKNTAFHTASKRLSQYLQTTSRVTNDKLRKLEAQYNDVRGSYDESRVMLEKELLKLIEERHDVIKECFSKMAPLQEVLMEQDKQFLLLSKEISKSLQEPKKQASRCKHDHRH